MFCGVCTHTTLVANGSANQVKVSTRVDNGTNNAKQETTVALNGYHDFACKGGVNKWTNCSPTKIDIDPATTASVDSVTQNGGGWKRKSN